MVPRGGRRGRRSSFGGGATRCRADVPNPPLPSDGDDAWRGRLGRAEGKGKGGGHLAGAHVGGFGGKGGKGAKLMGPKFGGGGVLGQSRDPPAKGKGPDKDDRSYGGMARLR